MPRPGVLITGCASGIGRDAALTLQARGWRVLATCRKSEDVAELEAAGLEAFALDYADPLSVEAAAEEANSRLDGRLTGLVNNGAFAIPAPLEDVPREAMRLIFETNVIGWHDLTRRMLPSLRASGRGRVVNISSVLGLVSLRYRGPYNATKFAIEGLSDALRRELEGREAPPGPRLRVSLIEPGPIRSGFRARSLAWTEALAERRGSLWQTAWEEKIMPRLSRPEPEALDRFELRAEAVTRRIVHALESPRPKARYYVTAPTWIAALAARALPTRALDRLFAGDQ